MALSLTVIPSVLLAQKSATEHTIRANEAVKTELNFNDRQDYEDANRGFIASIDGNAVLDKEGKVSYSVEEWDFLKSNTPQTANPSLWRQSQLNRINGLFEVIPDKLYQVRGFDIANMTFIRSDNGWIIIDVTTTDAAAKAGYDLIKKHVADLPVQGVIFTHPHGDHYGGIAAVKEASSKKDFDIIAPKGFMPPIREKTAPLNTLEADGSWVTVWGEVFSYETRDNRDGTKTRHTFNITDNTSSITISIWADNKRDKDKLAALEAVKPGVCVLVSGKYDYDEYAKNNILRPKSIAVVAKYVKQDNEPEKRVELHLHTKMSAMDGVSEAGDLVARAASWGHKAIAITESQPTLSHQFLDGEKAG